MSCRAEPPVTRDWSCRPCGRTPRTANYKKENLSMGTRSGMKLPSSGHEAAIVATAYQANEDESVGYINQRLPVRRNGSRTRFGMSHKALRVC